MAEVLTNNQRYLIEKLKYDLAYLDFEKVEDFYIKPYCGVWCIVNYSLFGDECITMNIKLSRKREAYEIRAFAEYATIIVRVSDISTTKISDTMKMLCIRGL